MWQPFDKRGRLRIWIVPLFVLMTAGYILAAIAVTLYSGLANAAIWWIVSGFFLWVLVMMAAVSEMVRLQRKADSEGEELISVGVKHSGSMILAGALLLVLGLVGILLNFFLGLCVASVGCGSLPSQAVPTFLASLTAGAVLLVTVIVLASRGLRRGAGAKIR